MQAALRKYGVRAYVCTAGETKLAPGEMWEDSITNALATCTTFVVLGTRTYGVEGRETVDTKKELRYATVAKKDVVVLKMTETYAEPYAQMQLDARQSLWWAPGTALQPEIVAHIAGRVQCDETLRSAEARRLATPIGSDAAVVMQDADSKDDLARDDEVVLSLESEARCR